jgi:hypothetical protein
MLENYNDPWIGVDLDGTLAEHLPEFDISKIGPPIPAMVSTVKSYLANGKKVKIFTARASLIFDLSWDEYNAQVKEPIDEWCRIHIGEALPITCSKDFYTIGIVDDIAVHAYKGDIYNAGTHLALKAQFDHLQEKYNKLEIQVSNLQEDIAYRDIAITSLKVDVKERSQSLVEMIFAENPRVDKITKETIEYLQKDIEDLKEIIKNYADDEKQRQEQERKVQDVSEMLRGSWKPKGNWDLNQQENTQ